jgi:hypothetical protein
MNINCSSLSNRFSTAVDGLNAPINGLDSMLRAIYTPLLRGVKYIILTH